MEVFRRRIGRLISSVDGLHLLDNRWYTARGIHHQLGKTKFRLHGTTFESSYEYGLQEASAIVTVAKKTA
jgi:hypothetical protein